MSDRNISNIILVGFMGTGKTSVGIRLAEVLGMTFVDTDDLIEKDSGMIISDIFSKHGEDYFRDLESKVAEEISKQKKQVIATGGGIIRREKNIENFRQTGILFCLDASPETILERTSGDNHRPLLQVDDPISRIHNLLKERDPLYAKADYRINTSDLSIDQVADRIHNIWKEAIVNVTTIRGKKNCSKYT